MTDDTQETTQKPDDQPMDAQQLLLHEVKFFYDLQKLRISAGNRKVSEAVQLEKRSIDYLDQRSDLFKTMERKSLSEIKRLLKHHPMWPWLQKQKGCGPTMAGVICSTIDIHRAGTVSALWAYAGLHVSNETGRAPKRKRGEKFNHNPFLKAKLLKVLADCFIKSKSDWTSHYYAYKARKQNQMVPVCMACGGNGHLKDKTPCKNCGATGGPAPWGASDAHRDLAARRYMIKSFLRELWTEWRKAEGLPVGETYAEAYLGRRHGDHGGTMPEHRESRMH